MSEGGARSHVDLRVATYNIHRCRGMDRRVIPSRIAEVLREIGRRRRRAAGGRRRRAGRGGTSRGDRRGARHGVGDGVGATSPQPSVRQRRAQPLPDRAAHPVRPVVADVRAARVPARRSRPRRRRGSSTSTTCTSALPCSNAATRRHASASFVHDRRVTGPKIILGDFNEWMRGLATKTLSSLFESIDSAPTCAAAGPIPASSPSSISITSTTRARWTCAAVELPRTRKALMASDHLPLVANLRIGFVE